MSISARNGKHYDQYGRETILHGVNMVHKTSDILPWREDDFCTARQWGMNVIRLGMTWYGVEPEPGLYNDSYFDQLRQCVAWAKKYDLHVLLDMHQDCFSYRVTGEHPDNQRHEWYALTDGLSHENPGSTWSDAYTTSPAVKRMFDNFWSNTPAGDGIGLQDHYAAAWERIAEVFADEPAVIGYNIMNEPNPGSINEKIMTPVLLRGAIALFFRRGKLVTSLDQVVNLWLDQKQREQITALFADTRLFLRIIGAGGRLLRKTERRLLEPFFSKVRSAIRKQDSTTLIAIEPMTAEYMGVESGVTNSWMGTDTDEKERCMYVPHLYDIVVDTGNESGFSRDRLHGIGERHIRDGRRMGLPVTIGEWGAFGNVDGGALAGEAYVEYFEKNLAGDIYWAYSPDERENSDKPFFQSIHRPVVLAASGTIASVATDKKAGLFTLKMHGDPGIKEPSVVYVPGKATHISAEACTLRKAGEWGTFIQIPSRSTAGASTVVVSYG